MKTKAERLDEILFKFQMDSFFFGESGKKFDMFEMKEKAKCKIIALFKECVPNNPYDGFTMDEDDWRFAFESCRNETLKNIEELR